MRPNNDKGTPEFWLSIKPGDILSISDERTIKDRMAAGKGVGKDDVAISSCDRVEIRNGRGQKMAEYVILGVADGRRVFVKLVDRAIGLSMYKEADGWDPSTRKALLEQECTFLWAAPEDENNWEAKDLKYIDEVHHNETKTCYLLKPQGELTGLVSYNPAKEGATGHFATIAEYAASEACDNPEMAVLEVGESDHGLVRLLLGRPLSVSDVEILNKGE